MQDLRLITGFVVTLCAITFLNPAMASTSDATRDLVRMHEIHRVCVIYRHEEGKFPTTDAESTWFEKLVEGEWVSPDPSIMTPNGRLPCDVYGYPYVYEIVQGEPVLRSVGMNGLDDAGKDDDLDIRFGVNWGHWYKRRWPFAASISVVTAGLLLVVGAIGLRMRPLRWILLPALGVAMVMLPHVADPFLFSTARTAPKSMEHVVLVGAALTFIGLGTVVVRTLIHPRRRAARGCCSQCGYDRRGTRSFRCPECGFEHSGSLLSSDPKSPR